MVTGQGGKEQMETRTIPLQGPQHCAGLAGARRKLGSYDSAREHPREVWDTVLTPDGPLVPRTCMGTQTKQL